jgi:hypothetical protein
MFSIFLPESIIVNLDFKIFSWDVSENKISRKDMANLQSWGFNAIRPGAQSAKLQMVLQEIQRIW